jgi:hypothetical protein
MPWYSFPVFLTHWAQAVSWVVTPAKVGRGVETKFAAIKLMTMPDLRA